MANKVDHHQAESPLDYAERPAKRLRRSFVACQRCHSHKIKCSGGQPCHSCRQQPEGTIECVYPMRDRKVLIQESYLKRLEEENQLWKESTGRLARSRDHEKTISQDCQHSQTKNTAVEGTEGIEGSSANPDVDLRNPLLEDKAWFVPDNASTQPVYIGEAACTAFGTRLRQFLNGNEPVVSLSRSNYSKDKAFLRMAGPVFQLPNRTYAHLLLKVALRFLGNDYHLMLRRTTVEKMDTLYRNQCFDDPIFLCKLFALFAMGEMYANRRLSSTRGADIPGTGFFVQAMSLLQDIHEEATVPYVETLIIISLFSLALNRTNSAYTYAGMALRLCLTLGLHHNLPEGYIISAIEREHRVRVWWSVYILDRITSSKLGHPVTVRDSDIDVDLPSMDRLTPAEREEFSEPAHLVAHLRLARITGDIISDIYRRSRQDKAFVQNVHKILRSLRSWAEILPDSVRICSTNPQRYASRNVASLHLCFNQCVILTTRPILFHVFKSHFQEAAVTSPMTNALADACIIAARSSNSLLTQLWIDGGMAIFGYFDSHYLFSSTIILMMSSILRSSSADRDAVETASDVLQSMVNDGNLPAAGFYQHFCEIRKTLRGFNERGHFVTGCAIDEGLNVNGNEAQPSVAAPPPGIGQATGSYNVFPEQTALDDPSIQTFLTQPDIHWGFPTALENLEDMALSASWLFE